MAKLNPKLTVTSYVLELSEEELQMVFALTCVVEGMPNDSYRKVSQSIYDVIQEKTKWSSSDFTRKILEGTLKAKAYPNG